MSRFRLKQTYFSYKDCRLGYCLCKVPHQPLTSCPAPFSQHRSHIVYRLKAKVALAYPKLHFHLAHPANKTKNQNAPAYRAVRANIFITGKKRASGVSSYLAHHQQTAHPQENKLCTPWLNASSSPPYPCALISAHTKEDLPELPRQGLAGLHRGTHFPFSVPLNSASWQLALLPAKHRIALDMAME